MSSIETVPPVIDAEEARRERNRKLERTGRWLLPLLIMTAAVFSWDRICVWNEIPQYILPRPGVVLDTLIEGRRPVCLRPCWSPCASPCCRWRWPLSAVSDCQCCSHSLGLSR
jgi:hypothetical protein